MGPPAAHAPSIVGRDPDGRAFDPFASHQGPPTLGERGIHRQQSQSPGALHPAHARAPRAVPRAARTPSPAPSFGSAAQSSDAAQAQQNLTVLMHEEYGFSPTEAHQLAQSSAQFGLDELRRKWVLARVAKFLEVTPMSRRFGGKGPSGTQQLARLKARDAISAAQDPKLCAALESLMAAYLAGTALNLPWTLKQALVARLDDLTASELRLLSPIDQAIRCAAGLQLDEGLTSSASERRAGTALMQLYHEVAREQSARTEQEQLEYFFKLTQTLTPLSGHLEHDDATAIALLRLACDTALGWPQKGALFRALRDIHLLGPIWQWEPHRSGLALLASTGFVEPERDIEVLMHAATRWQQSARHQSLRRAVQRAPLLLLEDGPMAHEAGWRTLINAGNLLELSFHFAVQPRERRLAHKAFAALLQHAPANRHLVEDFTAHLSRPNRYALAALVLEAKNLPSSARGVAMQFAVALAICGKTPVSLEFYRDLLASLASRPETFEHASEAAILATLREPILRFVDAQTPKEERPSWLQALDANLELYGRRPALEPNT